MPDHSTASRSRVLACCPPCEVYSTRVFRFVSFRPAPRSRQKSLPKSSAEFAGHVAQPRISKHVRGRELPQRNGWAPNFVKSIVEQSTRLAILGNSDDESPMIEHVQCLRCRVQSFERRPMRRSQRAHPCLIRLAPAEQRDSLLAQQSVAIPRWNRSRLQGEPAHEASRFRERFKSDIRARSSSTNARAPTPARSPSRSVRRQSANLRAGARVL